MKRGERMNGGCPVPGPDVSDAWGLPKTLASLLGGFLICRASQFNIWECGQGVWEKEIYWEEKNIFRQGWVLYYNSTIGWDRVGPLGMVRYGAYVGKIAGIVNSLRHCDSAMHVRISWFEYICETCHPVDPHLRWKSYLVRRLTVSNVRKACEKCWALMLTMPRTPTLWTRWHVWPCGHLFIICRWSYLLH